MTKDLMRKFSEHCQNATFFPLENCSIYLCAFLNASREKKNPSMAINKIVGF